MIKTKKPKRPKPIKPPRGVMPAVAKVPTLKTYSTKAMGGSLPSIHKAFEGMKRPGQPVGSKKPRGG